MPVRVKMECQNCEAIEELECDSIYIIVVKDGKVETIAHELNYWERLGY